MALSGSARAEQADSAVSATRAAELATQMHDYAAVRAKSIVELQPFRTTQTARLAASDTTVSFISLNPNINAWFLLQVGAIGWSGPQNWHLENPDPKTQAVTLVPGAVPMLKISSPAGDTLCDLLTDKSAALHAARDTRVPYAPVCDGKLYLRNPSSGSRSMLEAATDFLRDNVWGGDQLVNFVKSTFYKDAFVVTAEQVASSAGGAENVGPGAAAVDPARGPRPVVSTRIGLGLDGAPDGRMTMGLWYPVTGVRGVFGSVIRPGVVDPAVERGRANRLDGVEAGALDYMVGIDLSLYDMGFGLGTDHPRVGWSVRPPYSVRPRGMPGPDGIGNSSPLVRLGMISPAQSRRVVASFIGGFKRNHGAFKYGDMATLNYGSHYGFIEQGTIFSKLQPRLSTFYQLADGTLDMKTWTQADNALLPQIAFARQNGVPLLERDPETGLGLPGARVTLWGPGNWSGSANADLRTLRSGVCMRRFGGKSYLLFGYFSSATPSAMVRVFQSYGCGYAMLLDMNAPELAYFAVYVHHAGQIFVEHLAPGMAATDKTSRNGTPIPRFLGFPDSRDFFYMVSRGTGP